MRNSGQKFFRDLEPKVLSRCAKLEEELNESYLSNYRIYYHHLVINI